MCKLGFLKSPWCAAWEAGEAAERLQEEPCPSSLRLRQWEPTSSCPDHPQGRCLNREGRIQPAVNSCNTCPGALQSQSPSSLWSGDISRDLKPMAAMSIDIPRPQVYKTNAISALFLAAEVDFPAPWPQSGSGRKACSQAVRQPGRR